MKLAIVVVAFSCCAWQIPSAQIPASQQRRRPVPLNSTLAAIPNNTAMDLGAVPETLTGTVATCYEDRTIFDYSRITYDSIHNQMLIFGGGHAATPRDDVMSLDLTTTLQWTSQYTPTATSGFTKPNIDTTHVAWASTGHPVSRHTYDLIPFDPATGEVILVASYDDISQCLGSLAKTDFVPVTSGVFSHYNTNTHTWTHTTTNQYNIGHETGSEYDPVSGLVLVFGETSVGGYGDRMWTYSPSSHAFTLQRSSGSLQSWGDAPNIVYFPPNDKFYLINAYDVNTGHANPVKIIEITPNRSNWSLTTFTDITTLVSGNGVNLNGYGWAYDSVNHVIGGGVTGGVFYTFDPVSRVMSPHTMLHQSTFGSFAPTDLYYHNIDFDPVDGVFVFISNFTPGLGGWRTWAYRYNGASGSGPPPLTVGGYPMPSLNDEKATYTKWGWTWTSGQETGNITDPITGTYSVVDPDIHGDTEGDDLWTYLMQYARSGNTLYQRRAQAWARYFKDDYLQNVGTSGQTYTDDRNGFGLDHFWGYGLLAWYTYTGDSAYLTAATNLAADLETMYNASTTTYSCLPPDSCLYGGWRTAGRHLIFLTRLVEITGSSRWQTLFNTVLTHCLTTPYYDTVRNMYFIGNQFDTNNLMYQTSGVPNQDYWTVGYRIWNTFQVAWLCEGLFKAYMMTSNPAIRTRLIHVADFVNQYALDATYQYASSWQGIDINNPTHVWQENTWFNTTVLGVGSTTPTLFDSVYTTDLVDILVIAYKLTGNMTYLNRAAYFFDRGTKGVDSSPTVRCATPTSVCHFVDTKFETSSSNQYLAWNKGELIYTYLLFENSGNPNVITTPTENDTLSKSGAGTVAPSGSLQYTINLGNSGGGASSTTLTVRDQLPTGVVAGSCTGVTNVTTVSCTNLGSSGALITATVTLTSAMAGGAANGAAVFRINTTAPSTTGTITNYASVDASGGTSPATPGPSCSGTSCGNSSTVVGTTPTARGTFRLRP